MSITNGFFFFFFHSGQQFPLSTQFLKSIPSRYSPDNGKIIQYFVKILCEIYSKLLFFLAQWRNICTDLPPDGPTVMIISLGDLLRAFKIKLFFFFFLTKSDFTFYSLICRPAFECNTEITAKIMKHLEWIYGRYKTGSVPVFVHEGKF